MDCSVISSDESTTASKNNNQDMVDVSSPFPVVVDDDANNLESVHGFTIKNPNLVSHPSVVGWPPISRGHRFANHMKSPEEHSGTTPEPKDVVFNKGYLPVKVNMDGALVGRKVDLIAHNSYETLAQTVEDMFFERENSVESRTDAGQSKLLDAKNEFVLTYEDKDGKCLLLGDVPWRFFLTSAKRLRIMRNSEANKLGDRKRAIASSPTSHEKKARVSTDDI